MTEATATADAADTSTATTDTTGAETTATDTTTTTTDAGTTTDTTGADKSGDTTTTEATDDKATDTKPAWGDDWRVQMAGGDEDVAKAIARYGSPKGVAKALKEAQATISSGKLKGPKPDASDEKAMAEWRKAEGIPEKPEDYKLPDTVVKRLTDDDKPLLSSFTEFAHGKGARPDVVEIASEWYITMQEQAAEKRAAEDAEATEVAEEALRKDWVGPEYKGNMTLAKRYIEGIPGVGDVWTEARLPDGRRLGDIPEFITWASDQGRQTFGDVTFARADTERAHSNRKAEIEQIMKTDMNRYYAEGLDKELTAILEKEEKRRK